MRREDKFIILGKVLASRRRLSVLMELSKGLRIPSQIAKATGMSLSEVSRVLRELREMGLVECKTPDLVKGRLYQLTNFGREIVSTLKRIMSDF